MNATKRFVFKRNKTKRNKNDKEKEQNERKELIVIHTLHTQSQYTKHITYRR